MASPTQITEHIRKKKLAGKGKVRKRKLNKEGSTPKKSVLFGDE